MIGKGGYGSVYLARYKENNKLYAIKLIKREGSLENASKNERDILVKIANIDNPFLLKIKFAFCDKNYLYIGTEFVQGGSLIGHMLLKENGRLDLEATKFYAIELLLAIECLHKNLIMHRDI